MNKNYCPYDRISPFYCKVNYRLDEFYRQFDAALIDGKGKYTILGEKLSCACNPEYCPRYLRHLIRNAYKYR